MTAAQALFVAGFVTVNVVVAVTVVVVLRGARAVDGGAWPARGVLSRLARLPAERGEANRWAHLAHRVSGVAIFAFLVLHLLDVSLYALSPARFDEVHALYGTPVMRVFECGLLLALLFHALNGLRLVAVDLFDLGARSATRVLGGVVVVSLVGTAAGSAVILAPVLTGGA